MCARWLHSKKIRPQWKERYNLNVHLLNPPETAALQQLQSRLMPDIRLTVGPELPNPATFEVLIAGRPSRLQLQASPNLRMLVIPFAGLPQVTRQVLQDFPGLAVHNLHHNAALTSEMALALLLAAAKFILPCDQALRRNDWTPRYHPPPAMALHGRTALILGFGHIGKRIGHACFALGMRVLAIRRRPGYPTSLDYPVEIYGIKALSELLPQADAILIALPATPQTEGLLGPEEISLLPPGAVLVNVGRGPIVDQHALFQALKERRLRAAGLDVWYHYPASEVEWENTPPADVPFHELENVVLSPHRAGGSSDTEALRMEHLAALLNAAAHGEPPPNLVNLTAGY